MVKIVADTTSGLPKKLIEEQNIALIPQIVIFGEQSFKDDTEIDTATFLTRLKESKELPKTAAPAPAFYDHVIGAAKASGEDVLVIAPSAKVSGTVRAALLAAQEHPDIDMRVVDSKTIAGNLATLVLVAARMQKEGSGIDNIEQAIKDLVEKGRLYFLVNTLEYLQKGGRIGGAKALIGELLQVKPILCVRDGQVEPFEQQRTKKKAILRLIEIVKNECPKGPGAHLCVMQADALAEAKEIVTELQKNMDISDIPIYELPPAIIVHGGPGALAVGFFVS